VKTFLNVIPLNNADAIFGEIITLLIRQIEHFADVGEKVQNATPTNLISRSSAHLKLNLSMPPALYYPEMMLAECLQTNCRLRKCESVNYLFSVLLPAAEALSVLDLMLESSSTSRFVSRSWSIILHLLYDAR
jgi:hypothetical protein